MASASKDSLRQKSRSSNGDRKKGGGDEPSKLASMAEVETQTQTVEMVYWTFGAA